MHKIFSYSFRFSITIDLCAVKASLNWDALTLVFNKKTYNYLSIAW